MPASVCRFYVLSICTLGEFLRLYDYICLQYGMMSDLPFDPFQGVD